VSGTAVPEAAQAVAAFGQLMLVALWTATLMGPRIMQLFRAVHERPPPPQFLLSNMKPVAEGNKNMGEQLDSSLNKIENVANEVQHVAIRAGDEDGQLLSVGPIDPQQAVLSGTGGRIVVQRVTSGPAVPPLPLHKTNELFLSPSALHAAKYMPGRADAPSSSFLGGKGNNNGIFSVLPFAVPAPTPRSGIAHTRADQLPPIVAPVPSTSPSAPADPSASTRPSTDRATSLTLADPWQETPRPAMALTARNLLLHLPPLGEGMQTDESQRAEHRRSLFEPVAQQRRTLMEPLAHALLKHAAEMQAALEEAHEGDKLCHRTASPSERSGSTSSNHSDSAGSAGMGVDTAPSLVLPSPNHRRGGDGNGSGSSGSSSPRSLLQLFQERGTPSLLDRQLYFRSAATYLRAVDIAVNAALIGGHSGTTTRTGSPTFGSPPILPASPSATATAAGPQSSWTLANFPATVALPWTAGTASSAADSLSPKGVVSNSNLMLLASSGLLDVLQAHYWSAEPGVGFAPLATRLAATAEEDEAAEHGTALAPYTATAASRAHADIATPTLALLQFIVQLQCDLAACIEQILPPPSTLRTASTSSSSSSWRTLSSHAHLSAQTSAHTSAHPSSHPSLAPSPVVHQPHAPSFPSPPPIEEEATAAYRPDSGDAAEVYDGATDDNEPPLSYCPPSVMEMDPTNSALTNSSGGGGGIIPNSQVQPDAFVLHYESSSSRRPDDGEEEDM